jgi:hypothetical protein
MIQLKMTLPNWWLLGLIVWLGIFETKLSVAQTFYLPERVHTPKIEIVTAQRVSFHPTRSQGVASREGIRQFTYQEAVVLRVSTKEYRLLPFNSMPVLYIGAFKYGIRNIIYGRGIHWLEVHITNLEQLSDGDPVILTTWPGGPWYFPNQFTDIDPPQFRHDLVEDKRWTVFGGFINHFYPNEISKSEMIGPYTIIRVSDGNVSQVVRSSKRGQFWFQGGLKLEENETYTVEALVNDVVLFSETVTRETADYPKWEIYLDSPPSIFFEIKGYVYDTAGSPISGVRLTLDKYHTVTTDENGYYRFVSLFAGTYTLTATKEGYSFAPVKIASDNGQPVIIDLVEKKPTQCLLYAVHDTAKSKAQLLTVDLSADELKITPLDWKLNQAEISLAVGNFDSDGSEEIVTAAQKGGHTITLWELDGQTMGSFDTLLSGILLAAGDLDGDGQSEIIAASRSTDRNTVNVYTASGKMLKTVKLFDNKTRIAPVVGDVDGDGKDDIIAGSLLKADQVAIYYSATQQRQLFSVFQGEDDKPHDNKKPAHQPKTKKGYGVQVATGDFDGDGTNEIVAAQASKGSRVEIYQLNGTFQRAFDAFDSQQGVVITVGNVVGDSSPEIIVGEAKGHLIRVFNGDGEQLFEWETVKRGEVSSLAVFDCL